LAARPVLEGNIRRRLLALPKVDNGAEETITADLVVDASGRGSWSPAWLESFGYARPEEWKIEIEIGYTTRVYRRRPTNLGGKLECVPGAISGWFLRPLGQASTGQGRRGGDALGGHREGAAARTERSRLAAGGAQQVQQTKAPPTQRLAESARVAAEKAQQAA
jgi:hypothetical protein